MRLKITRFGGSTTYNKPLLERTSVRVALAILVPLGVLGNLWLATVDQGNRNGR